MIVRGAAHDAVGLGSRQAEVARWNGQHVAMVACDLSVRRTAPGRSFRVARADTENGATPDAAISATGLDKERHRTASDGLQEMLARDANVETPAIGTPAARSWLLGVFGLRRVPQNVQFALCHRGQAAFGDAAALRAAQSTYRMTMNCALFCRTGLDVADSRRGRWSAVCGRRWLGNQRSAIDCGPESAPDRHSALAVEDAVAAGLERRVGRRRAAAQREHAHNQSQQWHSHKPEGMSGRDTLPLHTR